VCTATRTLCKIVIIEAFNKFHIQLRTPLADPTAGWPRAVGAEGDGLVLGGPFCSGKCGPGG